MGFCRLWRKPPSDSMQHKPAPVPSFYVKMQSRVWKKHRFAMVCLTVHSGRVGQGAKTKNALRLEVGNSLKKVNRDNNCSLKKVNRNNKCNLKEPHKESPAQAPKLPSLRTN